MEPKHDLSVPPTKTVPRRRSGHALAGAPAAPAGARLIRWYARLPAFEQQYLLIATGGLTATFGRSQREAAMIYPV
jgi:hypothetical protein